MRPIRSWTFFQDATGFQRICSFIAYFFQAYGEDLSLFPDNEFDFAIITLVFCSVNDVDEVAREIRRVLKPRGSLLFMEHIADAKGNLLGPIYT